jgi:hypothetical protein
MVERIPQKLAAAGERMWRVPAYWEHDDEHDVVYDPYFADGGMILPSHAPPKDEALRRILDLIAKNAPSP